jgi:hypothetical protein
MEADSRRVEEKAWAFTAAIAAEQDKTMLEVAEDVER